MIKLYILPSSQSSRYAQATLTKMSQPFILQSMHKHPLSFEQLTEILSLTEDGVEDIIANGNERKMLEKEGVDFNEITLRELHYYANRFPKLIKAPIAVYKNKLVIGYSDEEYEVFRPRSIRLGSYFEHLEAARAYEDDKEAAGKKISAGIPGGYQYNY